MNFLDEATIKTNAANIAKVRAAASDDDTITVMEKMIGEANAFLAAADAARDKGEKTFEFPKGSGKMHKVTLKRDLDVKEGKLANALGGVALLAGLLLMNKIDSSDPVVQRLKAEYEQAEPAQKDSIQKLLTKRLIFLDSGEFDDSTPMNEDEYNPPEYSFFEDPAGKKGRFRSAVGYKPLKSPTDAKKDLKQFGKKAAKVASKRFDKGFAKFVGAEYETPFSDLVADLERVVDKSDNKELQKFAKKLSGIENMSQDEFNSFIKELGKEGYDRKEIKKMKDRYKKAQQDKKSKPKQKPKGVKEATITGEYEGKPVKFNLKDITNLKDILNISKSAKDFVNKVSMAVTDETSSLSKEDAKKLILFYNKRNMNEDLRGLMAQGEKMAAFANKQSGYEGGVSSPVRGVLAAMTAAGAPSFDGDEDLKAYWTRQLTKAIKTQMGRKYMSGLNEEAKDIELPADTTFTVDLKHLVKKHMNKGNDKDSAIKFTKALMTKLHNTGEVEVDGTKVKFIKEADLDIKDMQVALPEPDAPDYLGDDGMDYEGGMAKSQMLKMKKYAVALCDMIDDESQLESWVQAKLTKASDYMSSVYHYLDYQKSKMNETFELNGREVVDLEADGQYINKAYYLDTDKELNDNELDALINKYPADLEFGGEWWEQRR